MNGLETLLINNTASIVTTGGFLLYLLKKDKESNKMIQNHLEHSNKVIADNTEAKLSLVKTMQELCDYVKNVNGKKRRR